MIYTHKMVLLIFIRSLLLRRRLEIGGPAVSFLVCYSLFLTFNFDYSMLKFVMMVIVNLGNECCERLAYYGMSTNLVNYLQIRLNMDNVAASNSVTSWSGTCYLTPLIGAFLADAYLGRYWTIASFSIFYVFVSFSCKREQNFL